MCVYQTQGQVDDRDRTIRLQKNLIEKLEAEKLKAPQAAYDNSVKECVDTATQTERVCMNVIVIVYKYEYENIKI